MRFHRVETMGGEGRGEIMKKKNIYKNKEDEKKRKEQMYMQKKKI